MRVRKNERPFDIMQEAQSHTPCHVTAGTNFRQIPRRPLGKCQRVGTQPAPQAFHNLPGTCACDPLKSVHPRVTRFASGKRLTAALDAQLGMR